MWPPTNENLPGLCLGATSLLVSEIIPIQSSEKGLPATYNNGCLVKY